MATTSSAKKPYQKTSLYRELAWGESGTIIDVSGCDSINQDSAKKTLDRLSEQLGLVYNYFIAENGLNLNIAITRSENGGYSQIEEKKIEPLDILFLSLATSGFDKDSYTCTLPARVYSDPFYPLRDESVEPFALDIVVFPAGPDN